MPVSVRSLQSKAGLTIRTRKGATVYPESAPQNTVPFGVDNVSGTGTLLAGSNGTWVITSLVVSFNPAVNSTVRVSFTGGASAQASLPGSPSAPPPPPASLITAPMSIGNGTSFQFTVSGSGTVSISGTAYLATVASKTNPDAQVIASPIDSNPAGDLG